MSTACPERASSRQAWFLAAGIVTLSLWGAGIWFLYYRVPDHNEVLSDSGVLPHPDMQALIRVSELIVIHPLAVILLLSLFLLSVVYLLIELCHWLFLRTVLLVLLNLIPLVLMYHWDETVAASGARELIAPYQQ